MTSSSITNTGEPSSSNSPASSVPPSPSSTASSLATAATSAVSELSLKDVSDKDREAAAALKLEANAAFGKHDFAKAAEIYSKAIELNHTDATLFCNRAYARMKIEEHGYAIGDCSAYAVLFIYTLTVSLFDERITY